MLRFEWNALRLGDHVLVHDPRTAQMTLIDGVVVGVDMHEGANGVGIRVGADRGETAVLWPSAIAVHRDPRDRSEQCWRCQELAEGAASVLAAPPNPAPVGTDDHSPPDGARSLSGRT